MSDEQIHRALQRVQEVQTKQRHDRMKLHRLIDGYESKQQLLKQKHEEQVEVENTIARVKKEIVQLSHSTEAEGAEMIRLNQLMEHAIEQREAYEHHVAQTKADMQVAMEEYIWERHAKHAQMQLILAKQIRMDPAVHEHELEATIKQIKDMDELVKNFVQKLNTMEHHNVCTKCLIHSLPVDDEALTTHGFPS